jgi:hypothetical protein
MTAVEHRRLFARPRPSRPAVLSLAPVLWSVGYAILGLSWSLGGAGFPFGRAADPDADLSLLAGLTPERGAPVIAALAALGAVVGLVMAAGLGRGWARAGLLAFAGAAALGLSLVVPDYRVLVAVAYTPIFVIGAPFGWPPGVSLLEAYPWPVVNQFLSIIGAAAWTGAALTYARRTRGACPHCGRNAGTDDRSRAVALRVGRVAVAVAVAVPVLYAATRWAWALGLPLGISEAFLREGQADGRWLAGAALGTLALVGAGLTVGLVRPWGEVVPRWMPLLGGRRVPVAAAVVPALLVAVVVTAAGLMFVRLVASGDPRLIGGEFWGAVAPELLWPVWGLSLGAAAVAYHYRRRGSCRVCGLGRPDVPVTVREGRPASGGMV